MNRRISALLFAICITQCESSSTQDDMDLSSDAPEEADLQLGDAPITWIPPEMPRMTPCPDGWTETQAAGDDGPPVCEPWPGGLHRDCGDGYREQLPGHEQCEAPGPTCPSDGWPADLPTDQNIIYVSAYAPMGGTGTRDSPFASIAEAVGHATSGSIVALATGTYPERLIMGLPLAPGNIPVAGPLTLWGACIEGTSIVTPNTATYGPVISIGGLEVTLRNLRLHSDDFGGIQLTDSAHLDAEALFIDGAMYEGMSVAHSDVTAHGLVIRNVQGPGLSLYDEAHFQGSEVVIRNTTGIAATNHSRVQLEDFTVRDGGGMSVEEDLQLSRGVMECITGPAIVDYDPSYYAGVPPTDFSETSLSDMVFRDAPPQGACTNGPSPGDASQPIGTTAGGLIFAAGMRVLAQRVWFRDLGMGSTRLIDQAELTIEDSVFQHTRRFPSACVAAALFVAKFQGIPIGPSKMAYDAASEGSGEGSGAPLGASALAVLHRVYFVDNEGIAIFALGDGADVVGSDVIVSRTQPFENLPESCGDRPYGIGISSLGSSIQFNGFQVSNNALAGLQIATLGDLLLDDGLVAHNVIGINVQVDDFDFDQITSNVLYLDNERNLDAASLPVPTAEDFQ
jgi:hypothetical protein